MTPLPTVDMIATGLNINRLRCERGLSVRDIQNILGFNTPQAIYKWEWGKSLPTVDNLVILADIFNVTIDDILVIKR